MGLRQPCSNPFRHEACHGEQPALHGPALPVDGHAVEGEPAPQANDEVLGSGRDAFERSREEIRADGRPRGGLEVVGSGLERTDGEPSLRIGPAADPRRATVGPGEAEPHLRGHGLAIGIAHDPAHEQARGGAGLRARRPGPLASRVLLSRRRGPAPAVAGLGVGRGSGALAGGRPPIRVRPPVRRSGLSIASGGGPAFDGLAARGSGVFPSVQKEEDHRECREHPADDELRLQAHDRSSHQQADPDSGARTRRVAQGQAGRHPRRTPPGLPVQPLAQDRPRSPESRPHGLDRHALPLGDAGGAEVLEVPEEDHAPVRLVEGQRGADHALGRLRASDEVRGIRGCGGGPRSRLAARPPAIPSPEIRGEAPENRPEPRPRMPRRRSPERPEPGLLLQVVRRRLVDQGTAIRRTQVRWTRRDSSS
jgi:hypothetical protein